MNFENQKKTFLLKADHSKKGSPDSRIVPLLLALNAHPDFYTTSSCSGRAYLWQGTGKKNETTWIMMSHDLITSEFFNAPKPEGIIWLRLEPFILHLACRSLSMANAFLEQARKVYKHSSLLSVSNKIMVEVRGSEFLEMPFFRSGRLLYAGELSWLEKIINGKMRRIWRGEERFLRSMRKTVLKR